MLDPNQIHSKSRMLTFPGKGVIHLIRMILWKGKYPQVSVQVLNKHRVSYSVPGWEIFTVGLDRASGESGVSLGTAGARGEGGAAWGT